MISGATKYRASTPTLYSSVILGDGPLGYWRLGETSGSTAADSSGNGYNGTYVSCTQGVPSLISNNGGNLAASFAGGSTSEITVGAVAALYNLSRSFTLEWWMNPGAAASGTAYGIWSSGLSGFAARQNATSLEILADYSASLGTIAAGFAIGTRYYCVLTVDASGIATLYINGASVGTLNVSSTNFAGGYVRIGADGRDNGTWSTSFDGVLDEVAVYNKILTAAQILNHYNAGK